MRRVCVVPVCCFLLLSLHPLVSQTVTGKLEGRVLDKAEALVPGAKVTARQVETGLERTVTSNEAGFYQFAFMPLGTYNVRVDMAGFRPVQKAGVLVELNKATVSDFILELSAVKEVVTVTSEAPQIETTSGELKGTMDTRTVESTPLSGRNYMTLMELVPEFQLSAFSTSANNPTLSTGSYASFSGTGTRSTTFQIDGVNNDDSSENQNRQGVNVSAIKAVQVITNAYSAEFGRGAGGVVLVQTKGGANAFHGDLFEYMQNTHLAANSFFGNAAGRRADGTLVSPVSPTHRNQFGGTVGGPIFKDKLFFFFSAEQTTFRQFAVITKDIFLPTERLQVGDCDLCLKPSEHPNLQADMAFLQGIMDRFPKVAPNNFAQPGGRAYTSQSKHDFPDHDYSGRLDGRLFGQDTLVVRYQYSRQHRRPGEIIVGETARQNNKQVAVGATYTHIFSNRQVGEFRYGLGLRTTLVDISGGNTTPVIRFSGSPCCGSIIGNAGAFPINRRQNDYQYVYNHSLVTRKHTLRAGTDIRRTHLDDFSDNFSRRFWTFNVTVASATTRRYDAYENFLRGFVSSFTAGYGQFYLENRISEMNYFFQDDWRVRPNLTLNLGARYEYVAAPRDIKDRINYGFEADRNNFEPRFGFAYSPDYRGGWMNKLTGGPGKTSIRGGYGIFHSRIFQSFFSQGGANLRTQPPYGISKGFTATFNVADPTEGFVYDPKVDPGRISILKVDPGLHMPYSQQANLTIERQFPGNIAVSLGYRWVRGLGLVFYQWTNRARFPMVSPVNGITYDKVDPNLANTAPAPGFISLSQPRTNERRPDVRYTTTPVASNGVYSYYNGLILTVNKRFSKGLSFSSYWTWSKSLDTGSEATATSDTNAGITEFDSAKSLRGLSSFNAAHRFVFNWNYQIPSPMSKFKSSGVGRALDYVFSGWSWTGTYTASTGQPFTVTAGYDYNADGTANDRPILLDNKYLGASVDNGRIDPSTGTTYSVAQIPVGLFVPNFSSNPTSANRPFAPGSAGKDSIGRNTFFMHGQNNFDITLQKAIRIREGHALTFRAEFYNLLNRVQFSPPTTSVLTTTFGRISSTRNPTNYVGAARLTGSRFAQMALRYTF